MAVFAVALWGAMAAPADARPPIDAQIAGTARTQARSDVPARVPLPRPRPADAPANGEQPADTADSKPETAAEPPPPSACRLALTEAIAIAPSIPPIKGPGACGGDDLVRLEAVVLPDRGRVAVKPAAILRCTMATAIADWIRTDMAPLAQSMATRLSELDNFDSFECRGRNRVANAKMSEHGRANALDVRGLKLANGQSLSLTDRGVARDVREKVLGSVCGRFMTVLGPGSDGYHEDHIHLDLAERRNGYRICQWSVYDSMPEVAPLLPAPRPDDAPPREVADDAVEQLKVQPTAPPAVSLSPVPMAKQPANVAKPAAARAAATKSAATKSGATKAGGIKPNAPPPDAAKAEEAEPEEAKPEQAKPDAAKPASSAAKSGAAKSQPRAAAMPPPTSLVPSASSKTAATPKASAARSKSARKKPRKGQPDLPQLLRRMFD